MDDLLDYDEYYNDDEQQAYDHGFETGRRQGFIVSLIVHVVVVSVLWWLFYS